MMAVFHARLFYGLMVASCGVLLLNSAASAAVDGQQVVQHVDALVAAGEFGAAAEAASHADPEIRDELVQRVALAQSVAGDVAGASAALQQMSPNRSRVQTEANLARGEILGGGANFTELIQLIQNETDGPWFDVDAEGGTMTPFTSGIQVDPRGVLARVGRNDATGRVLALREQSRTASLNEDMLRASSLRLVSLTRLEQEVSRRLAEGKPVVESMKQLAGLSQVQYLFIYPESGEIVIGGPAEGWRYGAHGQPVGIDSGRPTLQLDDLVTLLRTFGPQGQSVFGCSIDPRQENLKAVKQFVADSQANGPLSPAGVKSWAKKVGTLLGQQEISVFGVPANSRVARVMVEADYRMKLIGIGKLDGGSNIPNYFELLAKDPSLASSNLEALRWWMTLKCDAVLYSPSRDAYEIRGSSVKCLSENEFLSENGQRLATGKAEPINQRFAANFTSHYQQLAAQDPIFADLQGIFDLAIVAALIQRDQLDQRAHWDRGVLADQGAYQPAVYAAPRQTESVVNHRVFNGRDVVLQVAGGVRWDVLAVLQDNQVAQPSPRLGGVAQAARAPELPAGRWWWDAR
jgi:hypothetical protein